MTVRRVTFAIVAAGVVAGALALSAQGAFHVKLASRASNGAAANGDSSTEGAELLSGDGNLVAFTSQAANLPGATGRPTRPTSGTCAPARPAW
jgi:hypothetical protein